MPHGRWARSSPGTGRHGSARRCSRCRPRMAGCRESRSSPCARWRATRGAARAHRGRTRKRGADAVSRREAVLSGALVFLVALVVRAWAATQVTFPRPEDAAYYVGVARNLVEGHGLTTDAIWSFQTPPLSFPRPAFEVWLPLPSFLMA